MRILITTVSVTIWVLAASVSSAAEIPSQAGNTASYQNNLRFTGSPGITTLQLSPMYVEIQQVLDQAGETEQFLMRTSSGSSTGSSAWRWTGNWAS
jgi:hypothetical protein